MNSARQIGPSWWYCLLGLPCLVAGAGFFLYTLFHGVRHVTDSLTQVIVPGKAELKLQGGRTYTVFYEWESVVNNRVYSTAESLSGLECRVGSIGAGESLTIRQPRMNSTYAVGSRSGRAVLEFPVVKDGLYEFACGYANGSASPEVVVAVGSGFQKALFGILFMSFGSLAAGGFLCAGVVITVALMRYRNHRKLAPATARF